MNDSLQYVGLTHQSAPLAIRENVRVDAEKLRTLLSRLGALTDGRLVLGTCERFEIYATTRHCLVPDWASMLSQWFHVPAALLSSHLRTLGGSAAAEHLLRVAAGLESRIIGEAQILGQVRDAFAAAQDMNALDAELSTLARAAIRTGKRVRHETSLGAGSRSIAAIALDALATGCRDASESTVAVVGTGRLAEVVLAELRRREIRHRIIVGRDAVRVNAMALTFETDAQPMSRLAQTLDRSDAAIVCTAAPTFIVDASSVSRDRPRRLWLFDLSVPRNVDPILGAFPSIKLLHLDQLVQTGASEQSSSIGNRKSEIGNSLIGSQSLSAEQIIQEELSGFLRWRSERAVAPQIARLVEEARTVSGDRRELHRRIERLKAEAAA